MVKPREIGVGPRSVDTGLTRSAIGSGVSVPVEILFGVYLGVIGRSDVLRRLEEEEAAVPDDADGAGTDAADDRTQRS